MGTPGDHRVDRMTHPGIFPRGLFIALYGITVCGKPWFVTPTIREKLPESQLLRIVHTNHDNMKACGSVVRTLPWDALARFGVPSRMLVVICQLNDGMQAFAWLDHGGYSYKFDVEQGLGQGCALAALLFNMFFTAVPRVAEKRFPSDAAITENMVQIKKKTKRERRRHATHRQSRRGGEKRRRRC